jgi:hypothetical protein
MTECRHKLKITDKYIFCEICGKRWYENTSVEFYPICPRPCEMPSQTFDPWRNETTITYTN